MPPRKRATGVLAAVRRDLQKLPEDLRYCAEAAAAIELAKTMDQGFHIATSSKELRTVLAGLRARAAAEAAGRAKAERGPAASAPEEKGPGASDLIGNVRTLRRSTTAG